MRGGGFGCAIGAVGTGGGTGGFPPGGCGDRFEVDADRLGLIGGVVPLGFLDGGTNDLVVEDSDAVCVGHEEELAVKTYYCLWQAVGNDLILEVEVTDPKDY